MANMMFQSTEDKIATLELIETARRQAEPASYLHDHLTDRGFTYRDCWVLLEIPNPLEILERDFSAREKQAILEQQQRESWAQYREVVADRRRIVLGHSRGTMEEITNQYRALLLPVIQAVAIGDHEAERQGVQRVLYWSGQLMECIHNAPMMDDGYLLINDGGAFVEFAHDQMLRRDHAGKVVTLCAPLLEHALRYRGVEPESKGLREEEGWRRTVSQAITGNRSGLPNNRLSRIEGAVTPFLRKRMEIMVRQMIREGHLSCGEVDVLSQVDASCPITGAARLFTWCRWSASMAFLKRLYR